MNQLFLELGELRKFIKSAIKLLDLPKDMKNENVLTQVVKKLALIWYIRLKCCIFRINYILK